MKPIYLDHNATSPLLPEVQAAIDEAFREVTGNPGSQHAAGRKARRMLDEARDKIAEMLGARVGTREDDRLILTSGGTESNNLALRALTVRPGTVVISSVEHPSVTEVARAMAREGRGVRTWPVDEQGRVVPEPHMPLLSPDVALVSVMLGNNETGVLQPVVEIAAAAATYSIPVHTDAVQVAGKLPIRFRELGVAALSISAHKFHGPVGVGALLVRADVPLQPWWAGGFQQDGMRPGTPPVALVIGMCRALELFHQQAEARRSRMERLRDRFEANILAQVPDAVVLGRKVARLPHTSNIVFPGCDRQALLMALDVRHVACSTGSACASGSSEPSPVLLAMGLPREFVDSALRFSLGATTTEEEVDEAAARIAQAVDEMRARGGRANRPMSTS